jgi:hypothetical protein
MHRPQSSLAGLIVAGVAVFAAAGCGGGSEQQLLQQYFQAARLRDQATLSNIATVSYNAQERGTIQSFSVVSVGQETRRPLELSKLRKAVDEAQMAEEEFSKRKKTYQDDNIEAIGRVLKAERANAKLGGRDAEVQAAWTKWRQETSDFSKKLQDARSALADERSHAEVSVYDPRNPVDVTEYDGELISKDVNITAQVRTPDGQSAERPMVVTMQRAVMKKAGAPDLNGRWVITDIRDSQAPTTSP